MCPGWLRAPAAHRCARRSARGDDLRDERVDLRLDRGGVAGRGAARPGFGPGERLRERARDRGETARIDRRPLLCGPAGATEDTARLLPRRPELGGRAFFVASLSPGVAGRSSATSASNASARAPMTWVLPAPVHPPVASSSRGSCPSPTGTRTLAICVINVIAPRRQLAGRWMGPRARRRSRCRLGHSRARPVVPPGQHPSARAMPEPAAPGISLGRRTGRRSAPVRIATLGWRDSCRRAGAVAGGSIPASQAY